MARRQSLRLAGSRVAAVLHEDRPVGEASAVDARLAMIRAGVAARRKGRSTRRAAAAAAAVVVCAAVVAGLFVERSQGPEALTFRVDGVEGELGHFVAASTAEVELAFDDGSTLWLEREGRARVVGVTPEGAHVVVEDGALRAEVVHRDETAWTITAGPFDVHVIGTSFRAAWDPSAEALTVAMIEGTVEVTGACLASPARLGASTAHPVGKELPTTLRFSCRDVVRAAAPSARASAWAAASTETASPSGTTRPSASAGAEPADTWQSASKRGEFKRAFELLEQSGTLDRMASLDAATLLEVANVARLAGRADVARKAFLTIRSAHPGSDAAATAAFHLGRAGGADAAGWLHTYLKEQPSGPFAREALGRLLELERDTAAGRALAAQYLERYPEGAHAPLARAILER